VNNKAKIASLGGIEAIISAMSTYKDHSEVQAHACSALCGLVSKDGMFLLICFLCDLDCESVMLSGLQ
jgi:hypothetical protein